MEELYIGQTESSKVEFSANGTTTFAEVLTSVTALGRHWRIDAGLNPDHQLVRSGPYSVVRHPIYASMLCLLLGTGLIVTPWPLFLAAIFIFLLGTELRISVEDGMLISQFGEEFNTYKRQMFA